MNGSAGISDRNSERGAIDEHGNMHGAQEKEYVTRSVVRLEHGVCEGVEGSATPLAET